MSDVTSSGNDVVINQSIDQLLENLPVGSLDRALGNNMYGINFRQTGNAVPRDRTFILI